jgi:HK97 family phage portal protein
LQDLLSALAGVVRNARSGSKTDRPPVPYSTDRGGLFGNSDSEVIGDRAYDAYGSVSTLFAIVSLLGSAFSSTEWGLYRKGPKRDKARRKEIMAHPIIDLWNNPNPFYTGRFFRMTVQQYIDLVGEGVILLSTFGGIPYHMWCVRPDRIKPVKDAKEYLLGYIYTSEDGEEVPLDLENVIHIKMPNPKDPFRGLGPVQSALMDLDAAKYSAQWNRNFFINGARPGGIIEVDHRMGDEEWLQFTQRWRSQHQGVANAHRVAVLENAKWHDVNFSMTDMQFVELRTLSREMIREAFAFPKPMLGSVDDVNRANAAVGERVFGRWQIVPRCDLWKDILNFQLIRRFTGGEKLELDYINPVPIDHETENATRTSKVNGAALLAKTGWNPDDALEAMELPPMRWVGPAQPQRVTVTGEPRETTEAEQADNLSRYGQAFASMDHVELERLERIAIDNAQRALRNKPIEIADHPYDNGQRYLAVRGD